MITLTCQGCGAAFDVKPYRANKARFCGRSCAGKDHAAKFLNTGPKPWAAETLAKHRHKSTSRFHKGHTPWNKDLKGLHLSPESEFQPGCDALNKMPVGSVTVRHRKREKHPRAWVKVAEPSVWRERAKVVWEAENGTIPDGYVIHHKDRNPLNDDPKNLQAMTREEHAREHEHEMREARYAG